MEIVSSFPLPVVREAATDSGFSLSLLWKLATNNWQLPFPERATNNWKPLQ